MTSPTSATLNGRALARQEGTLIEFPVPSGSNSPLELQLQKLRDHQESMSKEELKALEFLAKHWPNRVTSVKLGQWVNLSRTPALNLLKSLGQKGFAGYDKVPNKQSGIPAAHHYYLAKDLTPEAVFLFLAQTRGEDGGESAVAETNPTVADSPQPVTADSLDTLEADSNLAGRLSLNELVALLEALPVEKLQILEQADLAPGGSAIELQDSTGIARSTLQNHLQWLRTHPSEEQSFLTRSKRRGSGKSGTEYGYFLSAWLTRDLLAQVRGGSTHPQSLLAAAQPAQNSTHSASAPHSLAQREALNTMKEKLQQHSAGTGIASESGVDMQEVVDTLIDMVLELHQQMAQIQQGQKLTKSKQVEDLMRLRNRK